MTPEQKEKLKKLAKLALSNFLVFLAMLFILEIAVRIFGPDIIPMNQDKSLYKDKRFGETFGLAPNAKGNIWGAGVITNQYGFRIDPGNKEKKEKNILLLGDSISFGIGVEVSEAYPYMVNNTLEKYKIINTSVPAYDVQNYQEVLKWALKNLEFDGIVVGICLNDFNSVSQQKIVKQIADKDKKEQKTSPKSTKKISKKRYPNKFVWLLRYINNNIFNFNSFLRTYCRTYLLVKTMAVDTSRNYYIADTNLYKSGEAEKRIIEQLVKLEQVATKHNKWMLYLVFPYEYQLRNDKEDLLTAQKTIAKVAKDHNWKVLDCYAPLKDSKIATDKLYLYGDPMHFTPAGHKIIAETLIKELEKR